MEGGGDGGEFVGQKENFNSKQQSLINKLERKKQNIVGYITHL